MIYYVAISCNYVIYLFYLWHFHEFSRVSDSCQPDILYFFIIYFPLQEKLRYHLSTEAFKSFYYSLNTLRGAMFLSTLTSSSLGLKIIFSPPS